jgi:hypothetical protein
MKEITIRDKILKAAMWVSVVVSIVELALAQFHIRMTRLSAVETTGVTLFAFIIFGLVTLFAVTRMKESVAGKLFAILMNIVSAVSATWYLSLLFRDTLFFQNLYYAQNGAVLLPLSTRIAASMPLALIIAGTAGYYLSSLAILAALFVPVGSSGGKKDAV